MVLWPREFVAIYGERIGEESTHVEPPAPISSIPTHSTEDQRMNYSLQVLQLGVLLMQLNDTETEGDGQRSLRNWKLLMLYFRSRSRGMKYAFESMRFITFVKALYSERMAHRILHGQFVNPKGGHGKNYANDLKMEHEVRNNKSVLKGMCLGVKQQAQRNPDVQVRSHFECSQKFPVIFYKSAIYQIQLAILLVYPFAQNILLL